jgi:uncharacterized membrane protein YfcA
MDGVKLTVSKSFSLATLVVVGLLGVVKASIFNSPCINTAQCQLMYNNQYRCYDNHCMRKDFTYSTKDFVGFLLVIIISMITNAGGVGAGTIIIPAYIFFFDFVSSDAIPLSRVTIFAGSLVNYLINWTQRDPKDPNKFLINYNLASVMMPLLLAGTQIGVILSRFFPAAAITLVLFGYLISSSRQMLVRARKDTAKEKEQEKALQRDDSDASKTTSHEDKDEETNGNSMADMLDTSDRGQTNILQVSSSNPSRATELSSEISSKPSFNQSLPIRNGIQHESGPAFSTQDIPVTTTQLAISQWENLVSILFSLLVIVISSILKGGEGRPSLVGFERCSLGGWMIFFTTQILCVGLAVCTYYWNKYSFDEEDKMVNDTEEAILRPVLRRKLLWASYTTGVLAGFLGIGGGMVLGLYMLNLGMDIQVSTALSTFVVLFSSASTTFQFVIAGAIQLRHAWMFMILSLIGAVIGNFVLKALLKRYKRPSVLIWVLFGVLCIATAVLPIEMGFNVLSKSKSAIAFGEFC